MKILGISGMWHDAAASLTIDGDIVAAAQEERFTRIKHDERFPVNAIKFCLDQAEIRIEDLDAIAFYEKPNLKFNRVLESFVNYVPHGIATYLQAMPFMILDKFFFELRLKNKLRKAQNYRHSKFKLLFPEHHLTHAASAFYASPFEESAILTIDGVGEWATASISYGSGKDIKILKELRFPHSLGFLYSAFTEFLGFKVNNGEYKVMGLAPYGNLESDQVLHFIDLLKLEIIDIAQDGSIWLNQKYFRYATGEGIIRRSKWESLFGLEIRQQDGRIEQIHCNLALAIQKVTEEVVLKMAAESKRLTNSVNLCLSGGVALNCVANGKVLKSEIFKEIFIQPAAGDAGCSMGAALAVHHLYFGKERVIIKHQDKMKGYFLGPEYGDNEIKELIAKKGLMFHHLNDENELCVLIARLIGQGNVIGWFQGRMEFGPRALGNRSILGDATNPKMQSKINLKIKFRENFRPFAPSVLEEDVSKYFNLERRSPYMLLVTNVNESRQIKQPQNYYHLNLNEKLAVIRSDIQSVTHVDFSARVQTVNANFNPRFYKLIKSFKELTGYGLVINTSFNVRGEPIVCSPEDAYNCFTKTKMDYLVLGNYLFSKDQEKSMS